MATLTPEDIRSFAPQFADATEFPDALIQAWLDDVGTELQLDLFGDDRAQKSVWRLWVCHKLTVTRPGSAAAGGPLTSKTVGRVSAAYGAGPSTLTGSAADYARTSYGQQLQGRIDATFCGPLVP